MQEGSPKANGVSPIVAVNEIGGRAFHAKRARKVVLTSLFFFIVAGVAEIGGGYLVWLALREGKPIWYLLAGGMALMAYGVIPTLQPEPNFGRVYAAYGGIFVALSVLWGWKIDGVTPDRYDLLGAAICLVGVAVIMWAPRQA